jgi:hypothetical protein
LINIAKPEPIKIIEKMKIYLASTAPGHEGGADLPALKINKRLLSYHHILGNNFGSTIVFNALIGEEHAVKKNGSDSRPGRSKARSRH